MDEANDPLETLPALALGAPAATPDPQVRERVLLAAAPVVLVTECLQGDFMGPLAEGARRPSRVHVGRAASLKLLGDDPARGPLARFLEGYSGALRASPRHAAIHLKDEHAPDDPAHAAHFEAFKPHAIAGTPGAAFVAPVEAALGAPRTRVADFEPLLEGDALERLVAAAVAPGALRDAKVAVVGPWTEVAVTEVARRLRAAGARVAVADALTASLDEASHASALAALRSDGVEVMATGEDLLGWLG